VLFFNFFLNALNAVAADCDVLILVWLLFIRLLLGKSVLLMYKDKLRRVLSSHEGDGWFIKIRKYLSCLLSNKELNYYSG